MECDIHGTIEVRDKKCLCGTFSFATKLNLARDYHMFALMAGVRNKKGVTPIAPLRDLPSDISWQTKEEYDKSRSDFQMDSFLSFSEYKKAIELNPECCVCFDAYLKFMEAYEDNGFETRIVFWFDN